jgi:putative ABC transport system permease protein
MTHTIRDVAGAARRFRRKPLFLLGAALQLALAIGGTTALFTVMNAVMFRPLPLRDPDAVVALHVMRDGTSRGAFSLPMFLDVSASRRTLDGVAAYFQWSANLTDAGDAERLQGMRVTGNYLEVVGADVALGRGITLSDLGPESAPAVVIGDGLWKRRFGASRDAIGRTVRLNGEAFTVVGVLRSDFTFQVREAELLVPWMPERDSRRTHAALSFLRVVGRLAAGSSVPQAQAELDTHIAQFRRTYPDASAGDRAGRVVRLQEDIIGSVERPLQMLAASMALIMLIAAANLTNLLLINGAGRQQEFATRRSLGASPGRLIAQLLAEASVLAATGALIGIVVAALATSALLAMGGDVLPRAAEIRLDAGGVVFALLLSIGLSAATAVLPAVQLSSPSRNGAGQRSVTLGGRRLRAAFVCAEVALSVLLVIAAGLLVRSFAAVQRVEPGFQPSGVVSVRLSLPRARYMSTSAIARFYEQLAPRIRGIAGVEGAAAANVVPMNGYLATAAIEVPGLETQPGTGVPDVHYRMISSDYFSVMGIPVVSGRSFTDGDGASAMPVAMVSQGLAKRYWQGTSPIGARLRVRDDDGRFRSVEIVGIAGDVKHFGLEGETPRELYVPLAQVPDTTSIWLANNMYWVVRTQGSPLSYAHAIRREVAAVDADVASSFVRSMDQWLAQSVDPRRFNLRVIAGFALTALLLAVIGVYCVAAEAVMVRTREMGVRAAIGATGPQLTAAIVKSGLAPVLGGVLVGAGSALATTHALASSLYGVTAYDPATFAGVLLLVAAAGSIALYLPARRVARIDPVVALRTE